VTEPLEIVRDASADAVRSLFHEYADSLGFSLDFQDFEREVAELPGAYAPPRGLRPLDATTCDLKRLFVRPNARSAGLGRLLTEAAIAEARARGYARMRLDTVPGLEAAQTLCFKEVAPYTRNLVPGARFLELELD